MEKIAIAPCSNDDRIDSIVALLAIAH